MPGERLIDSTHSLERLTGVAQADFAQNLADLLVKSGKIDEHGAARARNAGKAAGERFDRALLKLGLIAERDLVECIAKLLDIPIFSPADLPQAPIESDRIKPQFVRLNGVLPLAITHEAIKLAVADPFNIDPIRSIAYLTRLSIDLRLISAADFAKAVDSVYAREPGRHASSAAVLDDAAQEADLRKLQEIASEAPIIRLVDEIIGDAVEGNASDIHIEPSENFVSIRYRIDGVLHPVRKLPILLRAAIVSRIKIMARLDIAERRLPQDGRARLVIRGADLDFRISTIPIVHGESVVIRILDRAGVALDFKSLGFAENTAAEFRRLLQLPNGVILVTGPTGSGKTTTLYAALRELNRPQAKILTVEDPVEYQIEGINQIQVQPAIELDFPRALRSILRQDPDIIMIGEIRDLETARIAIQASLTGHLVLSTLHTNNAAASVTRLVDMGVEPYLIASTLKGVVAQRLVRTLCPNCSAPVAEIAQWSAAAELAPGASAEPRREVGCEDCRHAGFTGREAIMELMAVNDRLQRMILGRAPDVDLEKAARDCGMTTLFESGIAMARRGATTLGEVVRVTRMN